MAAESRTLTVALDGSGDYSRIQDALDAARPGDTVLVRASTYTEDVNLRQGVTLRGEGPERSRLVAASGYALRGDGISDVAVLDLGIDGGGKEGYVAVYLTAAEVTVIGCVISGAALTGIGAANGTRLVLRVNTIRGNGEAGVYIWQDSEGRLEENLITENGLSGIAVMERGRLMARANTLRGNQTSGGFIYEGGEGVLEENLIAENGKHGITVQERGRLTARANTIARNTWCGVWVHTEGRAKLRHNIIAHNAEEGVDATGVEDNPPAAEVLLYRNCLWDNHPNYEGELDTTTDLHADPRFVNAAEGDYHLQPDSPCIGAGEQGEDLGALPFERPAPPDQGVIPPSLHTPLYTQLRTLPLCHVHAADFPPARPAAWLRGAGAAGWPLPLALARDLGLLLTQPAQRLTLAKPAHLPFDDDTSAYLASLQRVAAHPLVRELPAWRPPLSDAVLGVVLARLVEGLELPAAYRPPTGPEGVRFVRLLGDKLVETDPAALWRDTPRPHRPNWRSLLPPAALTRLERNLAALDREELRFLSRYGVPFSGAPDPRDLLDLLALTHLPSAARLALSQTLQLLPQVSAAHTVGGLQTYPTGGYEGLARKGSLDSLLPSERAYPEAVFRHRVFNHEALYYGRERPPERRRDLAYVVMQLGYGLGGDGQLLARALLLALGQALRRRGYEVLYSLVGSSLSPPRPLDKPGEVARVLHTYEAVLVDAERTLHSVLGALRGWRNTYQGRQVLWVLSEHFDADAADDHAALYRALHAEGGQQAWYIRLGPAPTHLPVLPPPTARYFARWQRLDTTLLHHSRP